MDFIALGTVFCLFISIFLVPSSYARKTEDKLLKMFSSKSDKCEVIDVEDLKDKVIHKVT
jgi:hypothetical protein